jgi:hypothetical protein
VNVTQDDESYALDFVKRYKLTFPVGHDTSGDIALLYAVKSAPTISFIDRSGTLLERYVGELTENEFRQRIDKYLSM